MSPDDLPYKAWTTEDAARLQQLRQLAGLDTLQLGRRYALSSQQIEELEGGGDSCFYSPGIKAAAGHRLLENLKADPRRA